MILSQKEREREREKETFEKNLKHPKHVKDYYEIYKIVQRDKATMIQLDLSLEYGLKTVEHVWEAHVTTVLIEGWFDILNYDVSVTSRNN